MNLSCARRPDAAGHIAWSVARHPVRKDRLKVSPFALSPYRKRVKKMTVPKILGVFARTDAGHSFTAGTRFGQKLRGLCVFAVQIQIH